MIFGTLNPEKIWRDNLTGLSVCPPHLSYVATLIQKSHFQQYMYYSYTLRIIYVISEENKL